MVVGAAVVAAVVEEDDSFPRLLGVVDLLEPIRSIL